MTVKELIDKLQNAVEHGQNPYADVLIWDPDSDDWEPASLIQFSEEEIHLYSGTP